MKILSIIVPVYNSAAFIERTLRSIILNDSSVLELLIIDDGSTDGSADIAENLLKDSNLKMSYSIIRAGNHGVSAARNKGLSVASGEYIMFCDSDDELLPGLTDLIMSLSPDSYDMISWPFINEKDGKCDTTKSIGSATLLSRNDILDMYLFRGYRLRLGSFAIKKDIIEKCTLRFTEQCQIAEDVECILKAVILCNTIYTIPSAYYIYHRHTGSLAYSYNIRRFEAPDAIGRIYEYYCSSILSADTSPLTPEQVEYIHNGLYILHTIYALDSCLNHINGLGELPKLSKKIREFYPDLSSEVRHRASQMKIYPSEYPVCRVRLLKLGIKPYLYLTGIRNLL